MCSSESSSPHSQDGAGEEAFEQRLSKESHKGTQTPVHMLCMSCPGLDCTFRTSLALHHSKGTVICDPVTIQTTRRFYQELLHPSSWPRGYSKFPSLVIGTSHLLGQPQVGSRPKQM